MPAHPFALALAAEMDVAGASQVQLAAAIGVAQPTLSRWMSMDVDEAPPSSTDDVFAIEAYLGLRPGTLSMHLGYLPIRTKATPMDVRSAINADERLSGEQRQAVISVYEVFTTKRRSSTRRMVG